MPYGETDLTQVMGIGSYVGEVCEAPDGQLYEWVEGVDGLGNPLGFWKKLKKIAKGAVRFATKALPYAAPFIPGIGPAAPLLKRAISFARPLVRQALPYAKFLPYPGAAVAANIASRALFPPRRRGPVAPAPPPPVAPPPVVEPPPAEAPPSEAEAEAPDDQLYEVVEGIGEDGRPRRMFRRVNLCIPATLRPRGRARMRRPTAATPAVPRQFRRFR